MDAYARLQHTCMGFPEVTERPSHGAPTWFVRDRRSFLTLWLHGHHDNEFPHFWCAAPAGAQAAMIAEDPDRFFRPPYVGQRGWLGVRLDTAIDWREIAEIVEEAYRCVAPARLIAALSPAPDPACG